MENLESQKKKVPYAVILLILIIIGMGGYIVYDKFIVSDSKSKSCTTSEDKNKSEDQSNTTTDEIESQRLTTSFGSIVTYKNGDSYLVSGNEISGVTANILGAKQKVNLVANEPDSANCIGIPAGTSLECDSASDGYKIKVSDIKSVYDLNYGQAVIENNLIALISDSGDLYLLTYYGPDTLGENKLKINGFEKSSINNVVSVVNNLTSLSSSPIAIDKNGNRHYIDAR